MTKKKLFFIFIFSSLILSATKLRAQCDDEMGVFTCAELFSGDSVIFLSDFTARGIKTKTTNDVRFDWDVYLNKQTSYRFALCCNDGIDDKELILYNNENPEENPLASTFLDGQDRIFFDFVCPKAGVYNVCIRFKDKNTTKRLCAIGLLGFNSKRGNKQR